MSAEKSMLFVGRATIYSGFTALEAVDVSSSAMIVCSVVVRCDGKRRCGNVVLHLAIRYLMCVEAL